MDKRNNYKIIDFLLWKFHHVISTSFCNLKSTCYCYNTGTFRRKSQDFGRWLYRSLWG